MDLTGHFLIAMPGLNDPNFERTVTFLCAHSNEGAMGVVINRPTEMHLSDVLDHLDVDITDPSVSSKAVLHGGPVERERGFVLHAPSGDWDSTLRVYLENDEEADTGVGVALSRDILNALATGDGPARTQFVLGYAGWGAGQLEREVRDNAWLNAPADADIIFDVPYEDRWARAAGLMGVDVGRLSAGFGNA